MTLKTLKLAALLCGSLAVVPARAQEAAPPPPAEFQVVRLGDGDMTCEALIAEIGSLNTQVQGMQMQMTAMGSEMSRSVMSATQRPGGIGGGALGLASAAAAFVPGASMLTGAATMIAQQAAQASAQRQQQQIMDQTASITEGVTAMAPMANRAAHLSEIARDKSC